MIHMTSKLSFPVYAKINFTNQKECFAISLINIELYVIQEKFLKNTQVISIIIQQKNLTPTN